MKYKCFIAVACVLVVSLFCTRLYYSYVPRGASLEPFLGYSRELPSIRSPAGKTYRVFVNDAGAMHSGNHWVWVVDHAWITGRRVVSDGYVTPEYATGEIALVVKWNGDEPVIQFAAGRYSAIE
jgi:hypothetical protein